MVRFFSPKDDHISVLGRGSMFSCWTYCDSFDSRRVFLRNMTPSKSSDQKITYIIICTVLTGDVMCTSC